MKFRIIIENSYGTFVGTELEKKTMDDYEDFIDEFHKELLHSPTLTLRLQKGTEGNMDVAFFPIDLISKSVIFFQVTKE